MQRQKPDIKIKYKNQNLKMHSNIVNAAFLKGLQSTIPSNIDFFL